MPYEFDWDPNKARTNRAKHNVDFSDARRAFDDPFAIDWSDDRQNYGEDRFITLGMVEGRLLHVTYTMPDDRTIRIVSARRARPNEKRKYHESQA
jgi:uncharacterized DUF497 family protein